MAKKFLEVGKCSYCDDPIYKHQEMTVKEGKKYHGGCYRLIIKEQAENKEVSIG